LADVRRRMCKRVGLHARRAAKRPAEFLAWLDAMPGEHRGVVTEALQPAVSALAALDGRESDPESAAAELLDGLREALLEASGRVTAGELAGEVDQVMASYEAAVPQGG
jgi:hypothetical protein